MINIQIEELKLKRNNIINNLNEELEMSYKFYQDNCDESFKAIDYYYKFVLFSMYRSIEDLICLLVEERKINSNCKNFYKLICEKNIKSFFINNEFFQIIFDDINVINDNISYKEIYDYIVQFLLNKMNITLRDINEIKPSHSNKNDGVNISSFIQIYKDCAENRNKLMHGIDAQVNLTKNCIVNSLFIYSFLILILSKKLK